MICPFCIFSWLLLTQLSQASFSEFEEAGSSKAPENRRNRIKAQSLLLLFLQTVALPKQQFVQLMILSNR